MSSSRERRWNHYGQQAETLEPLWAAVSMIKQLAQLREGFELEPCEAELRYISRELQKAKVKAQEMAKPLLGSEDPLIPEKVLKVIQKMRSPHTEAGIGWE